MITPQELKKLRAKTGMSQARLAEAVGIPARSIRKFESGKHRLGAKMEAEIRKALSPVGPGQL